MAHYLRASLRRDALARNQPDIVKFLVQQTGGTLTYVSGLEGLQSCLYHGSATGDFVQATADTLLGSVNDVLTATVFGATAMGTDSYGFVLALDGQVSKLVYMKYTLWLATEVANAIVGTATAPTNALTEVAYQTPAGNIAGRIIPAGFDAGTGLLEVELGVFFK